MVLTPDRGDEIVFLRKRLIHHDQSKNTLKKGFGKRDVDRHIVPQNHFKPYFCPRVYIYGIYIYIIYRDSQKDAVSSVSSARRLCLGRLHQVWRRIATATHARTGLGILNDFGGIYPAVN